MGGGGVTPTIDEKTNSIYKKQCHISIYHTCIICHISMEGNNAK